MCHARVVVPPARRVHTSRRPCSILSSFLDQRPCSRRRQEVIQNSCGRFHMPVPQVTIRELLPWMRDHLLAERPELFMKDDSV